MDYNTYQDILLHYGVIGMKWGKHKPRESVHLTTKYGDSITVEKLPTPAIAKILAKASPKISDNISKTSNSIIKDKTGKKVGDLTTYQESKKSLNVVWIGINDKASGNGYGSAVMSGVIRYAKKNNLDTVTLEVPGNSPNAKHIYKKLGFKEGNQISSNDDSWGGLTSMSLDLRKER